jgi:hypothetical protein
MALVKEDLVKGAAARYTQDGMVAVRAFHVSEIGESSPSGRLIAAIVAVMGQAVPDQAEHPDYPGIFADEFVPSPYLNSRDQATVLVTYRTPKAREGTTVTTFDASVESTSTNYDANRELIVVNYANAATGVTSKPQIARVSGGKSKGILEVDTLVGFDPKPRLVYHNKINDDTLFGEPKYCWWCSRFWYQRAKGKPGWKLRLTLQYDEETWIKTSVWRDIHDQIPEDVNPGAALSKELGQFNGYTNSLITGEADLSQLIRNISIDF